MDIRKILKISKKRKGILSYINMLKRYYYPVTFLFLIDQSIKRNIETENEENFPRQSKMKGIFIERVYNRGFFKGLMGEKRAFVKYSGIFAILYLFILLNREILWGKDHLKRLSLILMLSGGISNCYDRIFKGRVTDYLNIRYGKLKDLVFNIGDLLIFLGALSGIINAILMYLKKNNSF